MDEAVQTPRQKDRTGESAFRRGISSSYLEEMEPGPGPPSSQFDGILSLPLWGTLEDIESTNLARVIGRGPGGLHSNDLKALNLQILGKCLSSSRYMFLFGLHNYLGVSGARVQNGNLKEGSLLLPKMALFFIPMFFPTWRAKPLFPWGLDKDICHVLPCHCSLEKGKTSCQHLARGRS